MEVKIQVTALESDTQKIINVVDADSVFLDRKMTYEEMKTMSEIVKKRAKRIRRDISMNRTYLSPLRVNQNEQAH